MFEWLESKRTCMRLASAVEAKLGHMPQVRAASFAVRLYSWFQLAPAIGGQAGPHAAGKCSKLCGLLGIVLPPQCMKIRAAKLSSSGSRPACLWGASTARRVIFDTSCCNFLPNPAHPTGELP